MSKAGAIRIAPKDGVLSHGSPRNPVWEYILDLRVARNNFEFFDTPYCFVGHTHLPVMYQSSDGLGGVRLLVPETSKSVTLQPRTIINPGSVGQPRDRDPRAAFAIFDPELKIWEYHRVAYDVGRVQKAILEAGLPARHALRLSEGW